MHVIDTKIPDVKIIEPRVYGDDRGFFYESFNQNQFQKNIDANIDFVQDNHSKSEKGVLRGLHYQIKQPQGKLVRVIQGEVYDVAVDLRQSSETFGQWEGIILSADNYRQAWIPEGFAHGFLVLSDTAEFLYKTTNFYAQDYERCIRWDDPELGIDWPELEMDIKLSDKDKKGISFSNAEYFS